MEQDKNYDFNVNIIKIIGIIWMILGVLWIILSFIAFRPLLLLPGFLILTGFSLFSLKKTGLYLIGIIFLCFSFIFFATLSVRGLTVGSFIEEIIVIASFFFVLSRRAILY